MVFSRQPEASQHPSGCWLACLMQALKEILFSRRSADTPGLCSGTIRWPAIRSRSVCISTILYGCSQWSRSEGSEACFSPGATPRPEGERLTSDRSPPERHIFQHSRGSCCHGRGYVQLPASCVLSRITNILFSGFRRRFRLAEQNFYGSPSPSGAPDGLRQSRYSLAESACFRSRDSRFPGPGWISRRSRYARRSTATTLFYQSEGGHPGE